MLMSKSRLEKFLYALYSLDSSDLPNPLSRIEELYKCLVTGEEPPTFEPLSRVEKYLMAILGVYDVDSLPNPLSRVEVLLHKLAIGDDNLDDVISFLSEHEELLAEIIRNGGAGGNIDIEYVLYTLSTGYSTLYNTAEKPVKSAILKGNTKYRDIDTGDILDTFDETKNLELVSVKVPVLKTAGNNLFDGELEFGDINSTTGEPVNHPGRSRSKNFIKVIPSNSYFMYSDVPIDSTNFGVYIYQYDSNRNYIGLISVGEKNNVNLLNQTFTVDDDCHFIKIRTTIVSTLNFDIGVMSDGKNYEPYKSNILTVNEEVELRGIGDVKDELDLQTGKLTQRIGESNSENFTNCQYTMELFNGYCAAIIDLNNKNKALSSAVKTNLVPTQSFTDGLDCGIYNNPLNVVIFKKGATLEEFKNLVSNSIIQYQLETPTVKTVDLSVVDQDGNNTELKTFNDITYVTLSSERLIPEAELEVATKNEEVLNTLSLEMDDISTAQTTLEETSNSQSENVDATMLATTEIYEGLL